MPILFHKVFENILNLSRNCPWCGHKQGTPVTKRNGNVRCKHCGRMMDPPVK